MFGLMTGREGGLPGAAGERTVMGPDAGEAEAMRAAPQRTLAATVWTPEGEVPAPAATASPSAPGARSPVAIGEQALIDAIATVYDPEIPVNIYELGLIYAIEIGEDGAVKVEMTLTAPGCPSAQELPAQVQKAVLGVPGVRRCDVEVVWDPPWDPSRMSDEARLAVNMF